jgi:hypothetical protein
MVTGAPFPSDSCSAKSARHHGHSRNPSPAWPERGHRFRCLADRPGAHDLDRAFHRVADSFLGYGSESSEGSHHPSSFSHHGAQYRGVGKDLGKSVKENQPKAVTRSKTEAPSGSLYKLSDVQPVALPTHPNGHMVPSVAGMTNRRLS